MWSIAPPKTSNSDSHHLVVAYFGKAIGFIFVEIYYEVNRHVYAIFQGQYPDAARFDHALYRVGRASDKPIFVHDQTCTVIRYKLGPHCDHLQCQRRFPPARSSAYHHTTTVNSNGSGVDRSRR